MPGLRVVGAVALGALAAGAVAQAQVEAWQARFNRGPGTTTDRLASNTDWMGRWGVAVDSVGRVSVTGSAGDGSGFNDFVTVRYATNGAPLWTAVFENPAAGSQHDQATAVAVDGAGNTYVTGQSFNGANWDYMTVKYDGAGVEQWATPYNGAANGNDVPRAIAVDSAGDVYVTGESHGGATSLDYLTVKYGPSGVPEWEARYNGSGNYDDSAHAIFVDAAGNAYVTGGAFNASTGWDVVTIKYGPTGTPLWTRPFAGSYNYDVAYAVSADAAGNVYVTGYTQTSTFTGDALTIKCDAGGTVLWTRTYENPLPGVHHDMTYSHAVDASGNVYATGFTGDTTTNLFDYLTVKYDAAGTLKWAREFENPAAGSQDDTAYAIALDGLGGVYVVGRSHNGSNQDMVTVRYDGAGTQIWTATIDNGGNDYGTAMATGPNGSIVVAGTSDGLGPDYLSAKYVVAESNAPSDPSIVSTSPAEGTWSNDTTVEVTWSGAADEPGGSGLAGYSIEWNHTAVSTPDVVVDIPHGADPHSTTSAALVPDGNDWYFHLRTCDLAANCTATVHAGPFWIDTTAPSAPTGLISSSHATGVPSETDTIDVSWTMPVDGGSGIDGFSWAFTASPVWSCETTKDGEEGTAGASSGQLAAGSWYVHVCARDNAGNWGAASSAGPFLITDTTLPTTCALPFERSWGSFGTGAGEFRRPFGVAAGAGGEVVVADLDNNRLQLFDGQGNFVRQWPTAGMPVSVAIDSHGHAVVSNLSAENVQVFDLDGTFIDQWATGNPYGLTVDGADRVYAVNDIANQVSQYAHDGTLLLQFGSSGTGPGQFLRAWGIGAVPNGDLLVSDANGDRVQRFDSNGTYLTEWGGTGSALGQLSMPTGIAVSPEGVVYVGEAGNQRIQAFTLEGFPLCAWGTAGSGDGEFQDPLNLAYRSGHLYVADQFNHRVQKFGLDDQPPTDPAIVSTSPAQSTWTNDNTVEVTWSGAADDPGGSGLAGYSIEWNHTAASTPDAVIDLPHASDPHSTTSAALLPDGSDWYFHLRTCDLAGNCTATVHAGPFWIDTAAPTGLAAASTSHTASTWSSDPTVDFGFSGATDPNGIAGYSLVFDQLATTDPDGTVDQVGTTFIGSALPDSSSWYLHVRACDPAGNCGTTVHAGPYWIDTAAPGAPGTVTSASHGDGQPKSDDTVDIAWSAASDTLSGVALYRYGFTNSATPPACGSLATTTATLAGDSGNLSDGTWYAHACAVDHAGNEGAVATGGPYLIDLSPPQVLNVDSVASAGGSLEQGEATNVAITELLLAFDEAMDATLAGTPASYLLVEAGPNETIETAGCAVGGDDVAVAIDTASYAAGTATLGVNGGAALPDGRYELIACAALEDVAGNALDGDGDTAGGDAFVRAFTVDTVAPAVLATRIADDGRLLPDGLQTNATVTGIEIEFDERMSDPPGDGGAGDVDSPASYRLVFDLAGAFETESCGDGDPGDDADVAIDSVAWQDAARRATVAFNGGSALADGGYRFFACGTIADRAGNPLAAELAVDFRIDTQAPTLPSTLTSTTHAPFAWSGLATLGMLWSGAVDEPTGSGLAHYALALDALPAGVPDGAWTHAHGSDPHEVAAGPLASGAWYFHLVACDAAGNCAGPRHAGPYLVDFSGPAPPLAVVSPSHDGGPSQDPTIEVAWTSAIDDASGLAGYAWTFASSSSWACDEVEDGDESASTATSPPLGEGDWYFRLCARDNAGNWGATGSYGPWTIDTTAPQVVTLDSVPEAGLGVAAPPPVEVALTQLLVGFSEGMAESGAGAVTEGGNWLLVEAGGDAFVDTGACGPLAGDDVAVAISAVQYDAGMHLAALSVGSGTGLSAGSYRLLACPSLTDAAGNALTAAPWRSDFSVAVEPLASNPNFDADLSAWMVTGPVPGELSWLAEDAETKPFSGAARLDTAAGAGAFWYLETCVVLPAEGDYELSSVVRIGSAEPGAPAGRVFLTWVDTPTCFGTYTGLGQSGVLTGDSGGVWQPLAIPPVASPPGSGSVWISFEVQGGAAAAYTVDFDRVRFAPAHGLFSDDFETGAPCRWAGVVGGPLCP